MKIRPSMAELAKVAESKKELSFDPTLYADPLFGVGSATSAGPTMPSGSVHPSPETLEKDCGGYTRNQPIVGFGQAYISGSGGTKCYGNFLLAPTVDGVELDSAKRASFAVKGSERARSYEYVTELENGIKIEVTPSHNCAIYRFTYPKEREATLLIDVAHKLDIDDSIKNGFVTVDTDKNEIFGGGLCTGNWNGKDWQMFFTLNFDTPYTEEGFFEGEELKTTEKTATVSINEKKRFGAFVKFGTPSEPLTVTVKIAVSFDSVEKARLFMQEQIPDFDYESVKNKARNAWRNTLGVIELKTDDKALLRRFYTAMYHMNIQPRDRVSDHGTWDDLHTVWDSWKSVFPMYSLLFPEKMGAIIDSFIERAKRNEKEGNGIVLGDEYCAGKEFLAGQGGNDVDNVIADAYLKGIELKKYTWQDAYKVLLSSAEKMRTKGYIEKGFAANGDKDMTVSGLKYSWRLKSAAATLGFAFNDRAIANVATELGTEEEHEKYLKRSRSWQNVWNKELESEGFCGFPQSPRADGTFDPDFNAHGGYNKDFYEATAWDASYINYNDVEGLIEAMGGEDTFTKRLLWACEHSVNYFNDDHGAEGYLNFTNEPSFQIPWLFCHDRIKRPDLAAKVIDTVIKRFSLQDDYPGDEDNGGMSSYYVFLMCGFFPYSTTENYYLHGTRVSEISFRLGNGRVFKITGENVGDENIYVQSATLNGSPYNECKLTHAQILEGGELHFVMGDKPSDWAR